MTKLVVEEEQGKIDVLYVSTQHRIGKGILTSASLARRQFRRRISDRRGSAPGPSLFTTR